MKQLWSLYIALCVVGWVSADTTVDPSHPYAYAANVGWANARGDGAKGAAIGQFYCAGHVWSANCGWLMLGRGAPANGYAYANDSAADWGVNHDGEGRLTGYAYGANIGWVSFEQTYGQPRVDLRTGNLSGWAWGANVGWIGLSNVHAHVRTISLATGPDSDGDNLADAYEYRYAGKLTALSGLAGADWDGDGASDLDEAGADTDPLDKGDFLRIVSLRMSNTTNEVAWTVRPTRLYRLEATNTLMGTGTWADAGPGLLGPPLASPMSQTVSGVTDTTRFYRVKAIVPLSP